MDDSKSGMMVLPSEQDFSPGDFRVLITHNPDAVPRLKTLPDLILCGHTHGGQCRLPAYGAIKTSCVYGKKFEILMTSYPDYEPLSYTVFIGRYKTLNNVFEQTLQEILGENVEVKAETGNTFSDNQEYLKEGTFDMFMGLYNETHTQIKNFDHMEYLFPAIGNNPIHLITLPEKASQIKSLEDLKSLKGVYIAKEYFSDYVEQSLKNYNVEASLDIFDTYRKLFLGEIK